MYDLKLVELDDWFVLYVDGVKKAEGHSIRVYDLAPYINGSIESIWLDSEEDNELFWSYPETYVDFETTFKDYL